MDNNQNNFEQNNFEQQFTEPVVTLEPEEKKSVSAAKDPLFLVMCILLSVATVFSFGIIELLVVIGMWIAYANAQSGKSLLSGAKLCAGSVKALYSITWVLIGSYFLLGFISLLLALTPTPALIDNFERIIYELLDEYEELRPFFYRIFESGLELAIIILTFLLLGGIALIISAIILIFINIFFNKNLCKLAYSIRDNLASGAPVVKANTVAIWLIVLAVFQGIGILSSITDFGAFVSSGATLALYIITYIWIKKYFVEA